MSRVCVVSLGCAKNLTDSEVMLAKLHEGGYELTPTENDAEIVIVNTCCFIDSAKQESIETILEINDYRNTGELKLLIVAGCMGERFKQEILDELPEVDAVCGTGDFADICDIIEKAKEKRGVYMKGCANAPLDTTERIIATPPYTAYLKIAEGCSNHCTYCVIPSIRGKYRSRTMESITEEAEGLAQSGVKELVVIAQDTSCYGIDLYGKSMLHELLRRLSLIDGIIWIRVHYMYPEEITDEVIAEFASNEKLVNYFDIPVQHISDPVLKRMGRKTDGKSVKALIKKIRENIPDAVIRTSLITGFPGETEEDFSELVSFLREYRLDHVGVFCYSCEEGTPAAKYKDQLDDEIKQKRQEKLAEIQYEITEEKNNEKQGRTLTVLVEGYDKMLKMYFGRSYGSSIDVDPKVFFKSKVSVDAGCFAEVVIEDYIDCDLIGRVIGEEE